MVEFPVQDEVRICLEDSGQGLCDRGKVLKVSLVPGLKDEPLGSFVD
jgi:hypothetical protein